MSQLILKKSISGIEGMNALAHQIFDEFLSLESVFTLWLDGNIGAGKTHIAREILRLYGVQESIPSPTYTYVQSYEMSHRHFLHFDCYRVSDESVFIEKGLHDLIDSETPCLVEWGGNIKKIRETFFPKPFFFLRIDHGVGAGMRSIKLTRV